MTAQYSFYRPHVRVTEDNEITDPITGEISNPPSMTRQSFAAECDINNILKQYKKTGMIQHINAKAAQGTFMDLPEESDFQTALNTVIRAEEAFDALPSKLRARFHNDPAEFLMFTADPANSRELVELGLASARPQAQAPASVPDLGSGETPPPPKA